MPKKVKSKSKKTKPRSKKKLVKKGKKSPRLLKPNTKVINIHKRIEVVVPSQEHTADQRHRPAQRFSDAERESIVSDIDRLVSQGQSLGKASDTVSERHGLSRYFFFSRYRDWKSEVEDKQILRRIIAGDQFRPMSTLSFCKPCALTKVADWQGPQDTEHVPFIPECATRHCPECGSQERITSVEIRWKNIVSEPPPVLRLKIRTDERTDEIGWGYPYFNFRRCRGPCRSTDVGSIIFRHWNEPTTAEFKRYCPKCNRIRAVVT